MKRLIVIALLLSLGTAPAWSQTEKISSLLKLVAAGKVDDVKQAMPKLIADFPGEPGVKLIEGVLLEDGIRANGIYKSIVLNYPNSEWADDAQWRIVQFYAIIGDTVIAKKELAFFRTRYPKSEFLAPATDVVHSAIGTAKFDFKAKLNAPPPPVVKKEEPPQAEKEARYGLQVGVYSTKAAAESERKRFMAMKLRTDIVEKEIQGEKKFAVVIGNYSSEDSAETAKREVEKKCECTPMIYKK